MKVVLLIGVAGVCALFLGVVTYRWVSSRAASTELAVIEVPNRDESRVFKSDDPNMSVQFGFKCAWFAIKTDNRSAVQAALGLQDHHEVSWQEGIAGAYESEVFVSDPLMGWVFIVGQALPDDRERIEALLKTLSRQFSEAQYFATHRVVELQAWARAQNGSLLRSYKYLGESGEVLWVHGKPSPEEQALGVILQEIPGPSEDGGLPPDE